jgi:hypothetical protein
MRNQGFLIFLVAAAAVAAVTLAGCIQAVSDIGATGVTLNRPTSGAFFRGVTVTGLHYESGVQSGLTGDYGDFRFEVGADVTFRIGGVSIGGLRGRGIVTPIFLVPNGRSDHPETLNISRFLMMLDENGDPGDGIVISDAVREIAETWGPVDFGSADFEAELTGILSDVASVDARVPVLPDEATAQAHLEAELACLYSGGFRGNLANGDTGRFAIQIDPGTRSMRGYVYSIQNNLEQLRNLNGTTQLDFTQTQLSLLGVDTAAVTYNMQLPGFNNITGSWTDTGFTQPGSLAGGRIPPASIEVAYRYSGFLTGDDTGIFTLDIPADGRNAIGQMYSVIRDSTLVLNGNVVDGSLSLVGVDGSTTFNGIVDEENRVVRGSWANQFAVVTGEFSGTGCRLNPR